MTGADHIAGYGDEGQCADSSQRVTSIYTLTYEVGRYPA